MRAISLSFGPLLGLSILKFSASVLEGINRIGRCASLEDQLGSDEAGERGLQLVLGKAGDRVQQFV